MAQVGEGSFAAALRRLREARSWTQEELAERAGITAKAVGALERGERTRPYPHTVRSLADALGLDDSRRAELVATVGVSGRPGASSDEPGTPAGAPGEPGAPGTLAATLFGRDADLERITGLLDSGARLVTLTGPGGVGKTRVALELLARETARRRGTVVLVELAAVRNPDLVLPHLAAALGIPETTATDSTAGLVPALAGRRVLAVLDNLEHLLAAAPDIGDLVARCPDLLVVATSRAPLRLRSEREVAIAPLPVPTADSLDAVLASPAARLFLDRTAAAGEASPPDAESAPYVAEICRRLDGLPLALELVAAGARVLTPAALLARLDRLPPASPRDLAERQRSMQATVDWSLELLDPTAAQLFERLAVFPGGFDLDAAEEASGYDDVLPPLADLVEHSLVARTGSPDDAPRYRLLEPIRQDAAARLADSGLADEVRDRHARYFHDRAMSAGTVLRAGGLAPELDRLEADHANLRAAHGRLLELGRVADGAELAGTLWLYLALRGHAREGLTWLARLDAGASDSARCRGLTGRMGLLFATGDIGRMRGDAATATTLARRLGEGALAAETMTLAGHAAVFAGDLAEAREALDLATAWAAAADAAWVGIHALVARGQLGLASGDHAEAERALTEAVARARELGNPFSLATALTRLATVTALRQDDAATAALLGESTELSVAARMSWTLSYSLPALAGVAVRLDRAETAARLFGASASLSASHAVDPRFPVSRQLADRDLSAAREQLGEQAFAEAWDAGRTASPDEVAELARGLTRLALA